MRPRRSVSRLRNVSKQVRRETRNEQHPSKTGRRYDRDLPMEVVK